MNKIPTFYRKEYYDKVAVIEVTKKSLQKSTISIGSPNSLGRTIPLSVRIKDNLGFDCQVGSHGYNFFQRTKHGVNSLAYNSREQLERSVKFSLIARGFKFVGWRKKEN